MLRALCGSGRRSPARLNLPGAAFLLGLHGFDVITQDIVSSRNIFFFANFHSASCSNDCSVLQIQRGAV